MMFLNVCRIATSKGFSKYLDIANRIPDHKFYHIGSGHDKQLKEKLEESNAISLGWTSEEDKLKWLKKTDAYISTSKTEGFNLGILEAISFSKPVFATPILAHKEIYRNYITYCSTVDEFVEKLKDFIKNPNNFYNKDLADLIAKKYTWRNSAKRLHKVIFDDNEK